VTCDGFPLAHRTFAGNTRDLQTVETIATEVEQRSGKTKRMWVVERGMVSKESLAFRKHPGRRYLWMTLEHFSKQSELETENQPDRRRPYPSSKPRPMTPEVILRILGSLQFGHILLKTTDRGKPALRRAARPSPVQAKILAAVKLSLSERLTPDRVMY
jgi:hypothetical protein